MSTSGSSTGDGSADEGGGLPDGGASEDMPDQQQRLPILDPKVLEELEGDMGCSGIARTFVWDYIGMWDKRLRYLEQSVLNNDVELAMDAVLSLKNSAFMVGGLQLASLAVEVERLIRLHDLSTAQMLLPVVARTGRHTVVALETGYLRYGHGRRSLRQDAPRRSKATLPVSEPACIPRREL